MDKSSTPDAGRTRVHGALLALIVWAHSGCAMFQGSKQVTGDPANPRQEIVATKKCSPSAYPLKMTAGVCEMDAGGVEVEPDTFNKIVRAVGWHMVCLPVGLVADAIVLPYSLPAMLFSSECATTTAARPNKNYVAGKPAKLSLTSLAFADPANEAVLRAGEGGTISFALSNDADAGRADDLEAEISADLPNGLTFNRTQRIGDLGPGGSTPVRLNIEATDALADGHVTFAIRFREAGRNPPDPARIKINTRALRPPRFKVTRIAMDDGSPTDPKRLALGNGNGVLEPGESVELTITLANVGTGAADAVSVALAGDDGGDLHVLESEHFLRRYSIGRMRVNEGGRITFAVSVSRLYRGSAVLPLALQVSERRSRFNANIPLRIRVGERVPRTEFLTVLPSAIVSEAAARTSANDMDCLPGFYLRLPRDSTWYYGAGKGTTVAEARQKAVDALALQAGGAEAVSGFEQDDAAVCAGAAFILVRVEKAAVGKLARVPQR